jgi:arginyl-tRNA synthetase
VITAWLRRAILAAAGTTEEDPLLRPGGAPGSYASSLPFRLAGPGQDAREIATALAATLTGEPDIKTAAAQGSGYLTVTVTHDVLTTLAVRVAEAGEACAQSDALHGRTIPVPPDADLPAAPGWPQARAALAAELTARLAAAAGATPIFFPERALVPLPPPLPPPEPEAETIAAAISYAGYDAIRFALARSAPGGTTPQAAALARHTLGNPAYAVRYAHAAAAAVLRWAATLGTQPAEFQPPLLTQPEELALLDALSWLPERVAMAARRGRPDEFAGYLEELAARTLDTMSTLSFTNVSAISSERLWLAAAARTGLAACLGLLGIAAPERL